MSEGKTESVVISQLAKLRQPFPANQIGKLAKGSKAQMQCDAKEKKNCAVCGGWHHPKLIHLDYVGHAALTDRLLDVDPLWTWEPLALTPEGLPLFDGEGGLWGRVTICGRSMIGYGNAEPSQYKEVGSRQKEVIGDMLRNACMRLGCALDLWHKGDLHVEDAPGKPPKAKAEPLPPERNWIEEMRLASTPDELKDIYAEAYRATDDEERAKITMQKDKLKVAMNSQSNRND